MLISVLANQGFAVHRKMLEEIHTRFKITRIVPNNRGNFCTTIVSTGANFLALHAASVLFPDLQVRLPRDRKLILGFLR